MSKGFLYYTLYIKNDNNNSMRVFFTLELAF